MNKKNIILCLFAFTLLASSCEDWLTVRPRTEIEKDKMYEQEEGFWAALNGAYYLLKETYSPLGSFTTGALEYMAGTWNVGYESPQWRLWQSQYRSPQAEEILTPMFLRQYSLVAHANTILNYVENADFLPPATYNIVKGEALALRALSHMELLRLWGPMPTRVDVQKRYLPYVKEVSKTGNEYITYSEYTSLLEADLDSALVLLGKSDPLLKYSNAQMNRNTGINEYKELYWYWRQNRLNYYAVLGLRARFSLWVGDNQGALKYAMEVIEAKNEGGTPKFRLGAVTDVPATSDPLTNAAILKPEHLFSTHHRTFNANQYYPDGFNANTDKIERVFPDKGDFRYSAIWYVFDNRVGESRSTSKKYGGTATSFSDVWVPVIRLAEMYLIAIETADLNAANQLYEEFSNSRGFSPVILNENNKQSTLLMEYYKEFTLEGQIFFANKRMAISRPIWNQQEMSERQYVLPIPEREINF